MSECEPPAVFWSFVDRCLSSLRSLSQSSMRGQFDLMCSLVPITRCPLHGVAFVNVICACVHCCFAPVSISRLQSSHAAFAIGSLCRCCPCANCCCVVCDAGKLKAAAFVEKLQAAMNRYVFACVCACVWPFLFVSVLVLAGCVLLVCVDVVTLSFHTIIIVGFGVPFVVPAVFGLSW